MSIDVKTNGSGERRYEVRLRHPSGREYSRTFRTRREAERYESTERADRARGDWIDPRGGDITFSAWALEWLDANPAKSPSALARDASVLRAHLLRPLGDRRLASITRRDVQGLVTSWASQNRPRTVRRQYDTLRAILNAAVEADLIARNPCRGIHLPEWHQATRPVLDAEQMSCLATAVGAGNGLMVYVGGVWLPATAAAGLRGFQFHDLRRTAATALVQEHVDIKTAQARLGHADPRTMLGLYAQGHQRSRPSRPRNASESGSGPLRTPTNSCRRATTTLRHAG